MLWLPCSPLNWLLVWLWAHRNMRRTVSPAAGPHLPRPQPRFAVAVRRRHQVAQAVGVARLALRSSVRSGEQAGGCVGCGCVGCGRLAGRPRVRLRRQAGALRTAGSCSTLQPAAAHPSPNQPKGCPKCMRAPAAAAPPPPTLQLLESQGRSALSARSSSSPPRVCTPSADSMMALRRCASSPASGSEACGPLPAALAFPTRLRFMLTRSELH